MGYTGEQAAKYQADRQKRLKGEWIADNGPCKKCGSDVMLQIDHIDPSLKVTHNIWSWSKERRGIELAKCQVLCHDCHSQKSRLEKYEQKKRKRGGGDSKHIGVHWDKDKQMWRAQLSEHSKNRHLGYFASEDDAGEAHDRAVIKVNPDARMNIIT